MSNLQLRIVSALILIAVVLALTIVGGVAFRAFVGAMALAIFYEWATMTGLARERAALAINVVLLLIPLALLLGGLGAMTVFGAALFAIVASLVLALLLRQVRTGPLGIAYAALPAIALAFIRGNDTPGLVATLFLFAVVWATDIFAYFVGRAVGGPKLAPAISPGKTWSGAVGGMLCALAAGWAVAALAGAPTGLVLIATVALLSIVSQVGDLFESAVKRRCGVKDSSNLIPGHGGVMDRVDGLVAAALGLYVIGWLMSGPDAPSSGLFGM
ncbi:phosphatidate cytidylyltransferase [Mesorhizobium xinjiangense]|uniref:phosphatidate cytidylyltransferase n=1 Tax=Mesorhizobium xinjiangense TaxID=2678685 RepID=UPI0012ED4914|nr:phosphatidate cytidylyltransferase [Mesorhizobium xinjiangense]